MKNFFVDDNFDVISLGSTACSWSVVEETPPLPMPLKPSPSPKLQKPVEPLTAEEIQVIPMLAPVWFRFSWISRWFSLVISSSKMCLLHVNFLLLRKNLPNRQPQSPNQRAKALIFHAKAPDRWCSVRCYFYQIQTWHRVFKHSIFARSRPKRWCCFCQHIYLLPKYFFHDLKHWNLRRMRNFRHSCASFCMLANPEDAVHSICSTPTDQHPFFVNEISGKQIILDFSDTFRNSIFWKINTFCWCWRKHFHTSIHP